MWELIPSPNIKPHTLLISQYVVYYNYSILGVFTTYSGGGGFNTRRGLCEVDKDLYRGLGLYRDV